MKIYIAGKITGLDRAGVDRKFAEAAQKLSAEGHEVFVPTVLPYYEDVAHDDYIHVCYAIIDICDAVYMLADWQQSKGARMEMQYATEWRKQVLYQDEATKEART